MKFIENIKYKCNSNCPFRFKIIIAAEWLLSSPKKGMWEHRAAVPSVQKRLQFEGGPVWLTKNVLRLILVSF